MIYFKNARTKLDTIVNQSVFFRFTFYISDMLSRVFKSFVFIDIDYKNIIERSYCVKGLYALFLKVILCIRSLAKGTVFLPNMASSISISVVNCFKSSLIFGLLYKIFDLDISSLYQLMLIAFIGMVPFLPTMTVAVIFIVLCFMFVIRYVLLANDNSCLEQVGLYLFIFILVNMYTGITSITRTVSIKIALITTLFMLVFYIIYFFVNSSKKFYSMVFILATSAMFTGFYGLYQKYSGLMDATWLDKELFEGVTLRVFSTFGNPNVYGEYILLILPIVFAMIFVSKKIVAKLYYLFISAILLFNLLLTLSRGCYLALALAFFVFICLINVRLISLFIIGLFAIMPLLSDIVISRIVSITNFSDSSTSFRLMIWQGTLRMLKDFWFVGLGQGEAAFNSVYPLYSFNTVFAPHAHNVYLQIFVEMGILGLIIFIGLITVFLKTIISYKCKSLDDKFITAGFYAAFSGFLFQGLFDYVFYNYRIFLIFFIILGLSIAFINIKKREHIYDKGYKYNI